MKLLVSFDRDPVQYSKQFPFEKYTTKYGVKYFRKAFNKKLVQVINSENKRLSAK